MVIFFTEICELEKVLDEFLNWLVILEELPEESKQCQSLLSEQALFEDSLSSLYPTDLLPAPIPGN